MANGISLSIGSGDSVAINAEITFNVQEQGDNTAAHLSDVIYKLILEQLKEHPQAALDAGEYRLSMTVFATTIGTPKTVEEKALSLVKEILPNEVPDTDD